MKLVKTTLFWLITLIITKQLLWMVFIPVWQFPDEQAHFGQVQNIAEGRSDIFRGNNTSEEIYKSEVALGTNRDGMGNNNFTYHPEYKIPYSDTYVGFQERLINSQPLSSRNTLVIKEATFYPPLYYLLSSLFYKIFYFENLIERVYSVRMLNLAIYVLLAVFVYKIGKRIFLRNALAQVTLVMLVLFHPMLSFVGGGINSDNLFNLIFSGVILLTLNILDRGWSIRNVGLYILLFIFGMWTKPQGYLLLIPMSFLILFSIIKNRQNKFGKLGMITIALFVVVFLYKLFAGQLPIQEIQGPEIIDRLGIPSFLSYMKWALQHTYREVLPWYWGVYRWLSLTYPDAVRRLLNLLMLIAVTGLTKEFFNYLKHRVTIIKLNHFLLAGYCSVGYFMAITMYDYLFQLTYNYSIGVQGRYFFPVITMQMLLLYVGLLTWFPSKMRQLGSKVIGLFILCLHFYAFVYVVGSYYTASTLNQIIIQVSQYKPEIIKGWSIVVLSILSVILIFLFFWKYLKQLTHVYEKN